MDLHQCWVLFSGEAIAAEQEAGSVIDWCGILGAMKHDMKV